MSSSSSAPCRKNHDNFCFVCAKYVFHDDIRPITTSAFLRAYKNKFSLDITKRNVEWSPKVCHNQCARRLLDVVSPIKLTTPAIWNKSMNHLAECFFF